MTFLVSAYLARKQAVEALLPVAVTVHVQAKQAAGAVRRRYHNSAASVTE